MKKGLVVKDVLSPYKVTTIGENFIKFIELEKLYNGED